MTGMVDDLLDVSRVTRGLIKLETVRLDAKRIAAEAVEQVRPLIEARGHWLSLHTPAEAAMVDGDRKRLVQVVANLLVNAAKFTPQGGEIDLRIEVEAGRVSIEVADNGIGMSRELITRAFDLFAQAECDTDRSHGGLGIGLALARRLVELHGGSISAASDGQGKGACFTVCLPEAAGVALYTTEGTWMAVPAGRARKILVVDDNEDAAQMLAIVLRTMGRVVEVAHRARHALERAHHDVPDVFLLDIGLPDMDGHELARCLRVHPATARATLVAITGYGQECDREAAADAGFDHRFVKPVDSTRLAALLQELGER